MMPFSVRWRRRWCRIAGHRPVHRIGIGYYCTRCSRPLRVIHPDAYFQD